MLARNITKDKLAKAAKLVGVGIVEMRPKGNGFLFRLAPIGAKLGGRTKRYQLLRDRVVHAVCWHGFREFFRAAFMLEPGARFQTAQTRLNVPGGWYTAANFEEEHEKTDRNIGSMMYPLQYSDACECVERSLP